MTEKVFVKEISNIEENFPQWYTDVVLKTELVDYGPVKGTMVIRPYGYEIWEIVQQEFNKQFKKTGHKNAYFPMMIPYSYLTKESEHVEGFAPEVALVTHYGEEELTEKLVVRPTSETIICSMFSKWLHGWRDLPILINQWANVFRCEKTTRPFLRTSEFLWQEGHTLHETKEQAYEESQKMLKIYENFMKNIFAIPVITGIKSEKEKFAGAVSTYTMEAMMLDGKSLQAGTSHELGQNFSNAFDIKYYDRQSTLQYPYQTSWGVSTRLIGALIMAHGDQRGLKLPPKAAPIQVVIIPIGKNNEKVDKATKNLEKKLKRKQIRVVVDDSKQSPGWKFNQWEMKGVPLRVEIGPRDLENDKISLVRRDTLEKIECLSGDADKEISRILKNIQKAMYEKSKKFLTSNIKNVYSMQELEAAVNNKKFAKAMWCGDRACEDKIKEITSATSRCMPFKQEKISKTCVCCGKKASKLAIFARAY